MDGDKCDEQTGDHKHMQREESRQSRPGDNRAAEHQINDRRSHHRDAAGNRRPNAKAPVGILIESQNLPGEGHAQSHKQKKDADDPGEFTWKFIRAKQKHLDHMNQNDRHHEVRTPAVHGADEPAERDVVIQDLQAIPCFPGGWNVNQRQHDAGNDLQHEHYESSAAKNIKPAGRFARHWMFDCFANDIAHLQARIEPIANGLDQAHGFISRTIFEYGFEFAARPGVGISVALIISFPVSIRYWYSNSPRSGGPEAREPSW